MELLTLSYIKILLSRHLVGFMIVLKFTKKYSDSGIIAFNKNAKKLMSSINALSF